MSNVPEGFYFTEQHEWVKEEGGILLVGISDYAQEHLGDIVFVDFKPEGSELKAGEAVGAIESVKAAEDVYAPASGTVAETNPELADHPEKVNKAPYDSWIVKLKDYSADDLAKLMDSAAYGKFLESLAE